MVILITHQHQFLVNADKILYIEDGKQVICGSYDEIMALDTKFIGTLLHKGKEEESKVADNNLKLQTVEEVTEQKKEQTSVRVLRNSLKNKFLEIYTRLVYMLSLFSDEFLSTHKLAL